MNEKTAEIVSRYISGRPVRVSDRMMNAEKSMVVLLEPSTLLFRGLADLPSLVVGAMILRAYRTVNRNEWAECRIGSQERDALIREAEVLLRDRYPGLAEHAATSRLWNMLAIRRETLVKPNRGIPLSVSEGNIEAVDLPGVVQSGTKASKLILREIERGRVPVQYVPEFPSLPIYTVPGNLREAVSGPDQQDTFWRWCKEYRSVIDGYIECFKNQTLHEKWAVPRRESIYGQHLSQRTLYQLPLGRAGLQVPRPFRPRRHSSDAVFHPDRFCGVFGWDDYSVRSDSKEEDRHHMLLVLQLKVLELLEIPFSAYAFRDWVGTLSNGQKVYIHMPMCFKRIDEPFSDRIWRRVESLVFDGAAKEKGVASLQGVHTKTLTRKLKEQLTDEQDQLVHYYVSSRNFSWPKLSPPTDYASQAAESINLNIDEMLNETGREYHPVFVLPQSITESAPLDTWSTNSVI